MILGIDFDNTLVSYEGMFHAEAVRQGLLPPNSPSHKNGVRDALRRQGREEAFTRLQGLIYGPRLHTAMPHAGARECVARLLEQGVRIFIVSHKSCTPHAGPPHDLHTAASQWLEAQGFVGPGMLLPDQVFFEPTRAEKLQRIASLGCTHFVDDLPECLADAAFPPATERLLFDPQGEHAGSPYARFASWTLLQQWLLGALHA